MLTTTPMTGAQRMLAACRREPVDATPVWFMRQAGRSLADYRTLRERYDILTLATTPDLAAQVAIMPVDRLGVDACVLFADIMLPLTGMGIPYTIQPDIGPIIEHPIRTEADVDAIRIIEAEEATPYVFETVRILRRELGDRAAVLGFSGAPFTLACYLVEGRPSRDYARAKAMMFGNPALWHRLMSKITEVMVRYLRGQVDAGAQVIQLFDSWVGALSPAHYEAYVLPYSRRIFQELQPLGVPTVHFGTGAASLLELMAAAGSDIVSVDWRMGLDDAWARIGRDRGIQGNLDPAMVLAPWDAVQDGARDVLRRAGGRPGHVFNLGHGVLPQADPNVLARLVEFVHSETSSGATAP